MVVGVSSAEYKFLENRVLMYLHDGDAQKVYVEGWKGVGATALLRRVAEAVELKKRGFDTVIKVVQPALFRNPREIQRAVAKQLNLAPWATAAFDEADEDDVFSGKDVSSRGLLREVAWEIYRTVKDRSVLLVLCNNLADGVLIDPNNLDIPIGRREARNAILWTARTNTDEQAKSASMDFIARIYPRDEASTLAFVYTETVEIARYIDESSGGSLRTTPQIVLRCFWYCLLLCKAFNRSVLLDDDRPLEAAVKYFVCDGILEGDAAWEIGRALAPVIAPIVNDQLQYWEETFSTWTPAASELLPPKTLLIDSIAQKDWVKSPSKEEEGYHWILVRSFQSNIQEAWNFFDNCQGDQVRQRSVMSNVSSSFWHFEKTHEAIPNSFFHYCSNIRVLDLLGCIVSPINSFIFRLHNLRMLRLERCRVIEEQSSIGPSSLLLAGERQREPLLFDSLWILNLHNMDVNKFLLAGKAFELMPNLGELDLEDETSLLHMIAPNELQEHMHKLKVLKLSGNISTNFLLRSLSMAISLKELILTNCKGLVYLNFNLPATIEIISLQRCASLKEVELVDPATASLPNLKTFHLSGSKLIAKLSLQGCRKLENVDLQELVGLEVLNLSCTAIKVVDISKLQQLKQLLLLGCEQLHRVVCHPDNPKLNVLHLDNYNSNNTCNVDQCLDSFRNKKLTDFNERMNDFDQRLSQAHVVVKDVRLFRSLGYAFPDLSISKARSHIHVKSSSTIKNGINIDTVTKFNTTITSTLYYVDVLDRMMDRHHPSPPAVPLNNHIEVDGGHDSRMVEEDGFRYIMRFANSLFIHGNTSNFIMDVDFRYLKYLRIERCPNMEFIFSFRDAYDHLVELDSIWLSQHPRLKALCKQGRIGQLKHIYLEFCARLEYVFPSLSELHNLETINIRYCGDLTAIFIDDDNIKDKRGAAPKLLPNLKSIHLQELPKLQHIYKLNICAPSLEELKIRGCLNLRKLPLFGRSDARSMRSVKISCEKDWWDKLQWDGLESNHHSSLFNPKHCPYYKKPMKATYL